MNNKLTFSLVSWVITGLILLIVLLPIFSQIGDKYPFYLENIIFIIMCVSFTRFIFLTKHHWFSHVTWFKVLGIFAPIPLLLYTVDNLWDFQIFMDEGGLVEILEDLPLSSQSSLGKYIKAEMVFFWSGAFISTLALPFRMIHSIWTLRHRGKV